MWNLVMVHLKTVLVLVQDRCTVCAKHAICSEIILDTLMVLLSNEAKVGALLRQFGDSANPDAR
jgi:hypothetical protein